MKTWYLNKPYFINIINMIKIGDILKQINWDGSNMSIYIVTSVNYDERLIYANDGSIKFLDKGNAIYYFKTVK